MYDFTGKLEIIIQFHSVLLCCMLHLSSSENFRYYAAKGDLTEVRKLLASGANIDAIGPVSTPHSQLLALI